MVFILVTLCILGIIPFGLMCLAIYNLIEATFGGWTDTLILLGSMCLTALAIVAIVVCSMTL